MKSVILTVKGEPKGQPRARAFAMPTKGGKPMIRMYDPATAEGWKSAIADAWRASGSVRFEGNIAVSMFLYFKRPKAHFRTGKNILQLRDETLKWHTKKPDADNVAKAALDALTTLGAWHDDSQVCQLVIEKFWAREEPFSVITISNSDLSYYEI